jgi:hypothetical protein
MNPIHIHTQLNSTTLHLPQIAPLLGKQVEIIVQEEMPATVPGGQEGLTARLEAVQRAVEEIEDYDFDALQALDACDLHDIKRRLG